MLCSKPLLFSLLTLFFLSSTFFSFSHGDSHFPTFRTIPTSGEFYEGKYNLGVSLGTRRLLAVGPTGDEAAVNTSLILAAERTRRKDPLNDFKRYTGGWNISEGHYWAVDVPVSEPDTRTRVWDMCPTLSVGHPSRSMSVALTAAPLFVIGIAWFVLFGLCLSLICLCYCCCRREPYGYSRTAYALSLILLILFTIAAIIGCVVLYTGQGKYNNSTKKTLSYVVNQADITVENLRNVSGYLAAAKQIGVDQVFLPSNVQTDIDQIQTKINSSANTLADRTKDNSKAIRALLDSVRQALIVIAAVMLFLTFLGFLFSLLGMKFLVYILVIIGWILVAGTFILCGVFLLLHNVTGDTCVAMDEWIQNPTSHTALDDILPCVDNTTAQETLVKSKEVTSQLVNVINQVITNVSNINFSPNFRPLYFNQSGPLVPTLCNPFNSDLTDRVCSNGEVTLSNATEVWRNYVCEVSSAGICTTTGRLTPAFYNQMGAGVNVSFGLYRYGPFLVELEDCTFVRQTFGDIYRDHCPGLRKYSQWIYIGLVLVSSAVMLSLLFWVIYGRERRHRVYTKTLMARSEPGFQGDKEG